MLPGLDGTGVLFSPFIAVLSKALMPIIVSYPNDWPLDYDDLEHYLVERIKAEAPFVILAESFSGPLALRLAVKNPPNLVAVILCATFVDNPLPKLSSLILPALIEMILKLPIPNFLIRHLLTGKDASNDMIDTFREILKTVTPKVLTTRIQSVLTVDDTQVLVNCSHPILYLHATKDRIVSRRNIDRIRKFRPDIEVELIDGPHLLLHCMPEQAAEVIHSFLKRRNLCL